MDYIKQLIERYWEGETTLQEEQILRSFFAQEEVPEELQQHADYFRSLQSLSTLKMEREVAAEETRVVKARPLSLTERIRPYFRAAACVAIVAMLGGSVERAIERNAAEREARLAAQSSVQTDSVLTNMETLLDIRPAATTASADSVETTLPY